MFLKKKNGSGEFSIFHAGYGHDNGIDIYFFNYADGTYGGSAFGIGDETQCFLTSIFQEKGICHEVGHVLGLFHTFHRTDNDLSIELVSRTATSFITTTNNVVNCIVDGVIVPCCNVLGDRCCETPATRRLYELCVEPPNCEFYASHNSSTKECDAFGNDIPTDPVGDQYNISTNNPMSYIDHGCFNKYTSDQIQRMKWYLDNSPLTSLTLTTYDECDNCFEDEDPCVCSVLPNGSTVTDYLSLIAELENDGSDPSEQFEIGINGTFYVDQDLSIDEKWSLKMKENARIEVINGSTFTMINNKIEPCYDKRWGELYIESGSNIYFDNVSMFKGATAIRTQENTNSTAPKSNIVIHSCTIDNFTHSGIKIATNSTASLQTIDIHNVGEFGIDLVGDVDAEVLIGINIDDAETGIRKFNSPFWQQVNDCTFNDCMLGIRFQGSSGSIHDSEFNNIEGVGISLYKSNGTYVYKNKIGYNSYGITAENSNGVSINRNDIGNSSEYGISAISLFEVNYSSILGNQNMYASDFGIFGVQLNNVKIQGWTDPGSELITSHNNINIQGNQNTFSGGISLTMANKCEITDNFIFGSEVAYGIETNNATSSKIRNNHVSIASIPNMFRSAAIKNSAGVSAYVLDNETYSSDNANGIEVQNTSFSHYNCNDIYDTHDGLCIEHNSDIQELGTNHMVNAHNIDFITRSRLGIQRNKGNIYQGDKVRGYFSTTQDLQFSRFFVDESEPFHMPTDRVPDGDQWFEDNDKNDDVCLSAVGPTGQSTFFSSVTRLCDYWNDIKALKNNDPKLFLIKLTHLIRYFDAHPLLDIPDCIEMDPVFINLCGFHDMMDIIDRLNKLGDIGSSRKSLQNDISDLITLQDRYSILSDESKKATKLQEIRTKYKATKPEFAQEVLADVIDLNNIKSDLEAIKCNDEIIIIKQKTLLAFIEELNKDHLDVRPKLDKQVESISRLCSDEYGDAIHLARSIAALQGSTEYYDANDGCRDRSYISPRQSIQSDLNMVVSPNPSFGMINVDFGTAANGRISVINTKGVQIFSQKVIDSSIYNLNIETSGLYIIKFIHENGDVINKKAIIIN